MGKTLVRTSRRKYKKSAKGGKRTKRGRRVMKKSRRTKRRHMRGGGWSWKSQKPQENSDTLLPETQMFISRVSLKERGYPDVLCEYVSTLLTNKQVTQKLYEELDKTNKGLLINCIAAFLNYREIYKDLGESFNNDYLPHRYSDDFIHAIESERGRLFDALTAEQKANNLKIKRKNRENWNIQTGAPGVTASEPTAANDNDGNAAVTASLLPSTGGKSKRRRAVKKYKK